MGAPKRIQKFSHNKREVHRGRHRFEHWYVSNQVYFITARCRERFPAFASEAAKRVFWDRFEHYTHEAGFEPWVVSLLDNHYHVLGYATVGEHLKTLMQRLHGSVAKMVNDLIEPRRAHFWADEQGRDYFDGCIRDENQCRRAYRYTLIQSQRHGIVRDWRTYEHTRVWVELEACLKKARGLGAYLEGVPYQRYEGGRHTPR
ncbi:MAG: hypothetical protein GC162_10285 [Planctomycetes bacterium]|nr:hypothetical protein [Planctomycetota bacterium]